MDDEDLIRQSIKNKIKVPDIKVVFDSDDGQNLINYVKENGPWSIDIALIDIEMPLMNGLDLILQLKEINPDIHFIIITGHDDFKYMQKAIRLGVDDYILKPIIPDILNEVFNKCITKIKQRERILRQQCIDSLACYVANKGLIELDSNVSLKLKGIICKGLRCNSDYWVTYKAVNHGSENLMKKVLPLFILECVTY